MSYMLGDRTGRPGAHVVAAGGEIDMRAAPELRATIDRAIEGGASTLVVDLSEATFIDSTGIGVLLAAREQLRLAGGSLELVCIEPNLLRVFDIVGLRRHLSIHGSLDGALRAFAGAR